MIYFLLGLIALGCLTCLALMIRGFIKNRGKDRDSSKKAHFGNSHEYTEDDWSAAINRDAEAVDRWSKELSHGKK
ncbi:MAG: hypothetical protein VB055_09270 [Oscillospiraceae bacterium]|nr:hypothetical protein [Oscillospiraceae bacterium]